MDSTKIKKTRGCLRVFSFIALLLAAASTAGVTIAVASSHWLHTETKVGLDVIAESSYGRELNLEQGWVFFRYGLWKECLEFDHGEEECIALFWNYIDDGRVSSELNDYPEVKELSEPVGVIIFVGLFVQTIGLAFCVFVNLKPHYCFITVWGAVILVLSSLLVASGGLVYILGVGSLSWSHGNTRLWSLNVFKYRYGWSFYLLGGSTITSFISALILTSVGASKYYDKIKTKQCSSEPELELPETF